MNNKMQVDSRMTNQYILQKLQENQEFCTDGEVIFLKLDGYWKRIEKEKENVIIRDCFTEETQTALSSRRIQELILLIKENPKLQVEEREGNSGLIHFQNGYLDVITSEIKKCTDIENFQVPSVSARYIYNAKMEDAPVFLKYCSTSLNYNEDSEKTKLLLQIIGYVLSDFTKAKKAFFLIGAPSSGKSILLLWLKNILPAEDLTQVPFGKLAERFNLSQLRYSRVNVCSELAENAFPKIDVFKAVTGGDPLYGELKGQNPFSFRPVTTLVSAGNVLPLPKNTDGTLSVVDRLVILLFNHSIPRAEWDAELLEKLIEEKDIIASLAVDSIKELLYNNFQFVEPLESERYLQLYKAALDSVNVFVREECSLGNEYSILSTMLWEKYKEFCGNNLFQISISQQVFVNKMTEMEGISRRRERIDGRQHTVFYGIKHGNNLNEIEEKDDITGPRLDCDGQKSKSEDHPARIHREVVFINSPKRGKLL